MDPFDHNRQEYSTEHFSRQFQSAGAWLDRGEQAAVRHVVSSCRNQPILDIGVGAGRTVGLLSLISDDYLGIDFSPALLKRARLQYPEQSLALADARDLSHLPPSHYSLIMFSFNGIDSVNHQDRLMVMTQVETVLSDEGHFVYSTLNKDGALFDEPPWHASLVPLSTLIERFLRSSAKVALRNSEYRRKWREWWTLRHHTRDHGDWGEARLNGPGSGLVVHWSTPAATTVELAAAGLEPVVLFDLDGRTITDPHIDAPFFYVVARRRNHS